MKTACKKYPALCLDELGTCANNLEIPCRRTFEPNQVLPVDQVKSVQDFLNDLHTDEPVTGTAKLTDEIHHFKSGASSSGHKPPYECLTSTLLKRAALRMEKGLHYGKHNWKKGAHDKQFILDRLNHAIEHLIKAAHEIDDDALYSDDDLAAVVVNCMFAMEYQNGMIARQEVENQKAQYQETAESIKSETVQNKFRTGEWTTAIPEKSLRTKSEEALTQAIQLAKGPSKINDFRFHKDLVNLLNAHGIDTDMNINDSTIALMIITELHRWKYNAG